MELLTQATRATFFGAPGTYDRVIRGTIPAGKGVYKVEGSLPQPALHAATWLTEALESRGISVGSEARAANLPDAATTATTLDTYASPPLSELVQLTNFRSVNLFAEAFYAELGRRWGQPDDPSAIGERLVKEWSSKGLDTDGWEQVDGAGLGMRNMITPLQMAQVLQLSAKSGLRESLPRVGVEGTVRSVLRGQPRAARIRAKSGTLMRSRGFAGYATTADGRELAFVVMANNFTGSGSGLRVKLGKWMSALVE